MPQQSQTLIRVWVMRETIGFHRHQGFARSEVAPALLASAKEDRYTTKLDLTTLSHQQRLRLGEKAARAATRSFALDG
jgi:hypothetical protein